MLENQNNAMTYAVKEGRVFAFPIRFNASTEIHCFLSSGSGSGTELLRDVDFSVEPRGSYEHGSNIRLLMKVLPTGSTLTIRREVPYTQVTAFPTSGKLDSKSIERALDRIVMMCQQLSHELDHVEKLPEGEGSVLEFLEAVQTEAVAARDIALDASVSASKSAQLSMLGAKAVANIYTEISGNPDRANAMLTALQEVSGAAGAVAAAAAAAKSSIAGQEAEVRAALDEAAKKQKKAMAANVEAFDDQLEDMLTARIAEASGATDAAKAALNAAASELSSAVQRADALAKSIFKEAEETALHAIDKAEEKLEEVTAAGNAAQVAIESQRKYAIESIYKTLFDAEYDAEKTFKEALAGLYRAVEALFAEDGVVSEKEQAILDKIDYAVAEAVSGDAGALAQIQQLVASMVSEDGDLSVSEKQALEAIAAARQAAEEAMERYKAAADQAFDKLDESLNNLFREDGVISEKEQEFINALAAAKNEALKNADVEALQRFRQQLETFFAEDGVIDQREEEVLARIDAAIASAELQVVSAMGAVRLQMIELYDAVVALFNADGTISADERAIIDKLTPAKTNSAAIAQAQAVKSALADYFGDTPTEAQQALLAKLDSGGSVYEAARALSVSPIQSFRSELATLFGSSPGATERGLLGMVDDLATAAAPQAAGEVFARAMDGYPDKLQTLRQTLADSFGAFPYPAAETHVLELADAAIAEIADSTLGQQRALEAKLAEILALLEEYFGADGVFDAKEEAILDAIRNGGAAALAGLDDKIKEIFAEDGVIDQKEQAILDKFHDLVNGETAIDAMLAALRELWPPLTRTETEQSYLDLAAEGKTAALKGDVTKLERLQELLIAYFGDSPVPAQQNALDLLAAAIQKVKESALYQERERVQLELDAARIAALDAALAANRATGAAAQALAYASTASGYVSAASQSALSAAAAASRAQTIADAIQQKLDELDPSSTVDGHNQSADAHPALRSRIKALEDNAGTSVLNAIKTHNDDNNAHEPLRAKIAAVENRLNTGGIGNVSTDCLVVWGNNSGGQSGIGHKKVVYAPECLAYPLGASHFSFYDKGGLGIFGGKLYVTGANTNGFSGPGRDVTIGWQQLTDLSGWTRVSCCQHTGAAIRNKVLFTWGNGSRGAGGRGDNLDRWLPAYIRRRVESGNPAEFTDDWVEVACGNGHTLALTSGGAVYATGRNSSGQLGLGHTTHLFYFTRVPIPRPVRMIAAGGDVSDGSYRGLSAAITTTNELYTWGAGSDYRTGQNTTAKSVSPVKLAGSWKLVACGYRHLAAVGTDGAVYVAGHQTALGVKSAVRTLTRLAAGNIGTVAAIACGRDCTFILNTAGAVYSFGGGSSGKGKLGWSTTANQPTPVRIAASGAVALFGGCCNFGGGYVTDQFKRGLMDPSDTSDEDE